VTALAATDLRLRETRAADVLRRRLGMTPVAETHERSQRGGAPSEPKVVSATRD
jgi:hypothetical protein